jgi:hypothetical protein
MTMFPTIDFTSLQCSPPLISHHYNVPHHVLHHWFRIIPMFPTIDFTSLQRSPPCLPPLISHHDKVPHHWFHITTMFPTMFPPLISHYDNVPNHVPNHWFHIMTMFPTMFPTIDFTLWQCSPPCSQPLISHYDNVPHHVPHHWFTSQVELAEWKEEKHSAQKKPNKAPERDMRPGSSWLGWGYVCLWWWPLVARCFKLLVKSVNEWK